MSYILDALKRAERERKLGQAPLPLDEIAVPPPQSGKSGRSPLLIAAAVAVVLILAAACFLLLRGPKSPATEAAIAAEPVAAPAVADSQVTVAQDDAADARIADGDQIASLDDLTENADTAASASAEIAPSQPPPTSPYPVPAQPSAAVAAVEEENLSPDPDEPASDDDSAAAATSETLRLDPPPPAVQPAPPATPPVSTPPPELRRLKDMPASYRAEFPALTVDVHVYNGDPQRRFVLINGRRYREGDALAEGPRITQIVQDGIVVDWRGETLLYALSR